MYYDNDVIEHHGVLGMKWGVRHDKTSSGSKKKQSSATGRKARVAGTLTGAGGGLAAAAAINASRETARLKLAKTVGLIGGKAGITYTIGTHAGVGTTASSVMGDALATGLSSAVKAATNKRAMYDTAVLACNLTALNPATVALGGAALGLTAVAGAQLAKKYRSDKVNSETK